jgi:hypothetical protein
VKVTIGATEYNVFADVAFADAFLAADIGRAPVWEVLTVDGMKERALVSATRALARLDWKDGVPSVDAPPLVVSEATAILAADMIAAPKLADDLSAGSASNVKSVGAGPARVEFFRPVEGRSMPVAVFALLRPLLGSTSMGSDDPAFDNVAFGSGGYQESRFDESDYRIGMRGPGTEATRWGG